MDSGVYRGATVVSKFYLRILVAVCCVNFAAGEQLKQARVTQVVQDVKLLPKEQAARPAVLNDEISQSTGIRTGANSRSELTFNDLTITRLGANTVFSFNRDTRELTLSSGAALIQIPPGAPEMRLRTAAVSASITGGTAIFEASTAKFMVLEGKGWMWLTGDPEHKLTIYAGNMVWFAGGHILSPKSFDVKLVMKTSKLISGFAPLPNLKLILEVINEQADGQLAVLTKTFLDIIDQKIAASTAPEVAPPPPSEFGSPQTITSPNPYGIGGAVIKTDPTITSNGVTDFGTIYRNQSEDGAIATWAFGTTSAFDLDSGFRSDSGTSFDNTAVFKFQALQLDGPPTISTEGGVSRLGLIGVDGITSAGAGGNFTFSGLDFVFLATENGSINLGSGITFQGINRLLLYARGPNGNMTLSSQFNDIANLNLNAEGSIAMNGAAISHGGGNISLRSGSTSGAGIDLQAGSKLLSLLNSEAASGGTIRLTTRGGDIITNGEIEADNGTISISNSVPSTAQSNVLQLSAAPPMIVLGGSLTAAVVNVSSAGDLNVGTASPASIDAVTTLTLQAGRTLTWAGPMTISLMPNLIHTGGDMTLSAGGDIAVGGAMALNTELVSNLTSGGNISVSSSNGNVSAQTIQAGIKVDAGTAVTLGANLSLEAFGDVKTTSTSTAGGIVLGVDTSNGGTIGNGGAISIAAGGNVLTSGPIDVSLNNSNGRIGSDAAISLTAANVSANSFSYVLDNSKGGIIDGNASIVVNLSGDLTAAAGGLVQFRLLNSGNGAGLPSGNIGGIAAVTVTAANITADTLVADMDGDRGAIGTNAAITFNISGTVKTAGLADFHIEQADSPVGAAADTITFNGGTYRAGFFNAFVGSRDGTITFNDANVHADFVKVETLGSNGVLKIGGGSLNANTLLKLYAPGSNGMIDFVRSVTLSSGGAAVIAANSVTIENNVVVTLAGGSGFALVYTNHGNYTGSGGNGTTSGTFAGNLAFTLPLASAPPFDGASSRSTTLVTGSATSTQPSTTVETPPKRRHPRLATVTKAIANPVRQTTGGARMALRMADSSDLLDLIGDTASDGFSLAKHARSKVGKAQRDRIDSPRERNRQDSRRTFSASRGRMALASVGSPRP
ncbi:MAG: FecR domain-containing protein [Chthoniobacterales bacterium]